MIRIYIALLISFFVVFGNSTLSAQYHDQTFFKGKLQLLDKSKLKLGNVSFSDTAVHAMSLETGEDVLVPYYEIDKVKVLGNRRAFWEGIGVGLICSVAVTTIIVFKDGNPNDFQQYVSGFVRTAPLFCFLGGVIGLSIRTYDLVSMDELQKPTNDFSMSCFNSNTYQLGVSVSF